MTPSNSSAHSFARSNPCSKGYSPRSASVIGRLFEPAPDSPAPSALNGAAKINGLNGTHHHDERNGSDRGEALNVSEFLHETVAELWREERAGVLPAQTAHREAVAPASSQTMPECGAAKQVPEAAGSGIPTWKRVLDLSLILGTCLTWLPLMLLLMLAVRLSSPGPIFYRQERIGYRRARFMIYKFRSMKVDSETRVHEAHFERLMADSVPMVKLDGKGDPRILPWGRLMRATGLDELPQIFNVLRGEMSLVGPRPCTVHEFSRYAAWQQERVNAVPGLTGYWQVNGKNRTTFNEMIEMDIYYGKNLSLRLDLLILFQTFPALVDQTLESLAANARSLGRGSLRTNASSGEGV